MEQFHGTTIVSVRRGDRVALGGDGQVTLGNIVIKGTVENEYSNFPLLIVSYSDTVNVRNTLIFIAVICLTADIHIKSRSPSIF